MEVIYNKKILFISFSDRIMYEFFWIKIFFILYINLHIYIKLHSIDLN